MTRLELSIAWRYLRSRRGSHLLSLISVIAIGGVMVGVSALVLIMGVMNGLQNDLREKILVGSPDLRVLTWSDNLRMHDWRNVAKSVARQRDVQQVAPFVMAQVGITKNGEYAEAGLLYGIEALAPGAPTVTAIREQVKSGHFDFRSDDGRRRGIVIGYRMADRLHAFPGDTVTLVPISGVQVNQSVGSIVPRYIRVPVAGTFETGMYEYDDKGIYASLSAAQEIAGTGEDVTGLEVRTTSRAVAPGVARMLTDSLGFPYRTEDWQTQNKSLFEALNLEKLGMALILFLIVVVAAFNIVSTLTMVVTDKTKEIGILRAMGLPAASVRRIFWYQGMVIGLVGTVAGLVLGLGIAVPLDRYELIGLEPSVYFIDHLPVLIDLGEVALVALGSLAIAALATIYPARQAAKLYPVEAIRHE